MAESNTSYFLDLVYDALLKSFWRKKAFKRFLRRVHVSETFLATIDPDESKRDTLDRLFPLLEKTPKGIALIRQMAQELADQTTYPDLESWEDSSKKIADARQAVSALKDYLDRKEQEKQNEQIIQERREQAQQVQTKTIRSKADLAKLKERFEALLPSLGTTQGGYDFQDWFFDLMDYCEVENRRPYNSGGRQIDGSITVEGTTYLVELKFTSSQSDATDIDSLMTKVTRKADNTMGIMVSVSGYSSVAVSEASKDRTPLLLFDYAHVYMVLGETMSFQEMLKRVRRHCSQTCKAYLPANEFGG